MLQLQRASFLLGAAKLKQLPPDAGYEVAFAGRSNAGKSSALNAVTRQNKLARTSKTPGRTQEINVFQINESQRLIDLPGYGFAKVSARQKQSWQQTLTEYLETRRCLKGLILLADSRHALKDTDIILANWCIAANLPCHIVLTKADKLTQRDKTKSLKVVKEHFKTAAVISAQMFSATKKTGLAELEAQIVTWLEPEC